MTISFLGRMDYGTKYYEDELGRFRVDFTDTRTFSNSTFHRSKHRYLVTDKQTGDTKKVNSLSEARTWAEEQETKTPTPDDVVPTTKPVQERPNRIGKRLPEPTNQPKRRGKAKYAYTSPIRTCKQSTKFKID